MTDEKEPSKEALAYNDVLFNGWPIPEYARRRASLALDAWGEALRKERDEAESQLAITERQLTATRRELESLRKPLEGELAEDVAHLDFGRAEAFVMFDSANRNGVPLAAHQLEWLEEHRKFGHVDRVRAALRAKGDLLEEWELFGSEITGCTNHSGKIALEDARHALETHISVAAALRAKGEPQAAERTGEQAWEGLPESIAITLAKPSFIAGYDHQARVEAAMVTQAAEPANTACEFCGRTAMAGVCWCGKGPQAAEPPEPRALKAEAKRELLHELHAATNSFALRNPKEMARRARCPPLPFEYVASLDCAVSEMWDKYRSQPPEPATPAPELPRKVEPGTILTRGARYRITEIADWDTNPQHTIGDEFEPSQYDGPGHVYVQERGPYWVIGEGSYVTGLELVADAPKGESK